MSDDSIIKGLERRITKLENAKNVVISVAAILAIFVATFFNKLTAAQSQIAELTSQASSLKPLVEDSVAKIQDAADIQIAKLAAVAGASGVPLSVGSQSDHAVGPAASMGDASGAANSEQMTAVSLVDVETAQNYAKEMLKAAARSHCNEVRPLDWHRANTVIGKADQSKAEGQYSRALDEFTEVRISSERCMKGSA